LLFDFIGSLVDKFKDDPDLVHCLAYSLFNNKFVSMFKFKQFSIDQSGCAMKINTDGVLLGAMAAAEDPKSILDIGTGTGVIALMLAQRYNAQIDAVEIDEAAAQTAGRNFNASPFSERLAVYAMGFESYFERFPERKYDLVVSNPPFYIDSLKSPGAKKTLAKHTNADFFEKLVQDVANHLTPEGKCWLILPGNIADIVIGFGETFNIFPQKTTRVQSYESSQPHRVILSLGFNQVSPEMGNFIMYEAPGIYSKEYKQLLIPYFLAF
jgi:tRNA1Val (adenine37-N6)-methyltransferase